MHKTTAQPVAVAAAVRVPYASSVSVVTPPQVPAAVSLATASSSPQLAQYDTPKSPPVATAAVVVAPESPAPAPVDVSVASQSPPRAPVVAAYAAASSDATSASSAGHAGGDVKMHVHPATTDRYATLADQRGVVMQQYDARQQVVAGASNQHPASDTRAPAHADDDDVPQVLDAETAHALITDDSQAMLNQLTVTDHRRDLKVSLALAVSLYPPRH